MEASDASVVAPRGPGLGLGALPMYDEERFDEPDASLRPSSSPSCWPSHAKSMHRAAAPLPLQVLHHTDCLERFWGLEAQHPDSPVTLLLDCNLVCAHNLPTTGWLNNREPTCDTYARITLLHARPGEEPRMTQWSSREVGDSHHPRYQQRTRFAVPDFCDALLSEAPDGSRRDLSISNVLAKAQQPTQGLKFLSCFVEILVSSGARGEEVIGFARIPNEAFAESLHNEPRRVTLACAEPSEGGRPRAPRRELRWKGRSMELRLPLLPDCSGAGALAHFGLSKAKLCRGRWASKIGHRRPDDAYVRLDLRVSLRINADVESAFDDPYLLERPGSAASTRALSTASEEPIFSMTAVDSESELDALHEQVEDLTRERERYASPLEPHAKVKAALDPRIRAKAALDPSTRAKASLESFTRASALDSTRVQRYKREERPMLDDTDTIGGSQEPKMEEFFQRRLGPVTTGFAAAAEQTGDPLSQRRLSKPVAPPPTRAPTKSNLMNDSMECNSSRGASPSPTEKTSEVDDLLAAVLRKSLELKQQSQGTLQYVNDKYGLKAPEAAPATTKASLMKPQIFKATKYSFRPGRFGPQKKPFDDEPVLLDWSVEFGDRTTLGMRRFDYPFQYMQPSEYWKYRDEFPQLDGLEEEL
eukprot:scaffold898_cov229-Pinguiococcus_pyrenoidosus.AAC.3